MTTDLLPFPCPTPNQQFIQHCCRRLPRRSPSFSSANSFFAPRIPSLLSVPYHSFGFLLNFCLLLLPTYFFFLRRDLSLHKSDIFNSLPGSGIASITPGLDSSAFSASSAKQYIQLTLTLSTREFRDNALSQYNPYLTRTQPTLDRRFLALCDSSRDWATLCTAIADETR